MLEIICRKHEKHELNDKKHEKHEHTFLAIGINDEDVWSYLIDKAIVNRDKSITFQFRNGKEIKII